MGEILCRKNLRKISDVSHLYGIVAQDNQFRLECQTVLHQLLESFTFPFHISKYLRDMRNDIVMRWSALIAQGMGAMAKW